MKSVLKNIVAYLLQLESRAVLRKYKPKIIAVTGSVGKTSTKDTIFTALSSFCKVRKSDKSFNSDIGIPLTILGCPNAWNNPFSWFANLLKGLSLIIFKKNYPEWLILEVGADRPGDIKNVTKWLKPDIAVITRFAKVPVHVEYFKSREHIIREKEYLVDALKHDGTLVVNMDDDDAMKMADKFTDKKITYGVELKADIRAENISVLYDADGHPEGMTFRIDYQGSSVPIKIKGVLGIANVYSSLASIAVGVSCGVNLVGLGESLLMHDSPKGRMKIIKGIKNSTIIDDTYNSSPVAVKAGLELLKDIKTKGRKIAVFGDMMELGKHSVEEHKEVGKLVASTADVFFAVGLRSRLSAEGALGAEMSEKNILQFDGAKEAGLELQAFIDENDVIYVKGSQSMRMERVVEEVMTEPQDAEKLLVRQEKEWKKR